MSTIDDLEERNAVFAGEAFSPKDSLMPALKTIVISCVDPRVAPAHVLGLAARSPRTWPSGGCP